MTETPTHTIGSAGRLAILSREDLERLDAAALEVLAEVGVAIPSERARAALVAQGATADGVRVTMPAELVRRLVGLAPAHRRWASVPGAVPPCALATEVPVVADPGVFAPDVVYCGGGTTTTMLKIGSADLDALLEPRKLPIAARS